MDRGVEHALFQREKTLAQDLGPAGVELLSEPFETFPIHRRQIDLDRNRFSDPWGPPGCAMPVDHES